MITPTDPGAIVMYRMNLGCFVSDRRYDTPRRERPVVCDSLRYMRAFWVAREAEFKLDFDGLVDCVTAREVD